MKKVFNLSTKLSHDGLWFIFACINIYMLYLFFFPVKFFYFLDDWFVLTEKVWFESNIRWLGHLLFFNQNRFTWNGDFMLYRPGLFLVNWITDVLFRSDRLLQQSVVIFVDFLSLFGVYTFLRRFLDTVVALTVCLYLLFLPVESIVFRWPHLVSYLLAVGFYFWGLSYYVTGLDSRKNMLLAMILFVAATMFHELAVLSLAGLLLIQLARWGKTAHRLKLALLPPLVCYSLMILIVYSWADVPAVFGKDEASTIVLNAPFFARLGNGLWNLLSHALVLALPFGDMASPEVQWHQLLVAATVWAVGLWLLLTREREKLAAALPLIVAVAVITAGVLFGRVAPRNEISSNYYLLLMLFIIPLVVLCFSSVIQKNNFIKYSFVLMLTLSNVNFIYADSRLRQGDERVTPKIELTRNIKKSLTDQDNECFAGIISTTADSATSYLLNISLLNQACKSPIGEKPSIFIVSQPELTILDKAKFNVGKRYSVNLGPVNMKQSNEIAHLLVQYNYNIAQVKQRRRSAGDISIATIIDNSRDSDGFSFTMHSDDEFPVLYNFGFKIYSDGAKPLYLVFQNNFLLVLYNLYEFKSSLPFISQDFTITMIRDAGNLFILINDQIILQVPVAFADNSKIDFYTFDNGTSGETLAQASIITPADQENASAGVLQFFQPRD